MRNLVYILVLLLVSCASSKSIESTAAYKGLGTFDDASLEETAEIKIIGQEVQEEIAQEKLSEVAYADIPYVLNSQVEKWMTYFQGRGRKHFEKWLSRSGRYVPMMREILKENGLPEDLIYLSMIESGFSSYAHSRAKAMGQWQFIYHTGKRYGLKVNWWIDERRDPEKSTIAAAQYLKFLYDEFQHWYLAAAGYNAGENKIIRAIKRYNTDDFWEISKYPYLKPETKNYVPKLIAAATIAKDPLAYGFDNIEYQPPLAYEKVLAPEPVELKTIAKELGVSLAELKSLNPELIRDVTPPKYPNYELKVPVGQKGMFLAKYDAMPRYLAKDIMEHRVRSGEALSIIAKNYGVSASEIASFNNLPSQNKIRVGQILKIPVSDNTRAVQKTPQAPNLNNDGTYLVRSGDSYWSISRKFNVTVSQLKQMNPSIHANQLRPGQRLAVQSKQEQTLEPTSLAQTTPNTQEWEFYKVKEGDSLWTISKKLGLEVFDLAQWNNLNPKRAVIHPGKKLRFKPSA